MKTVLAVQITRADIIAGQTGDCHFCALALAVRRALANRGISGNVGVYDAVWFGENESDTNYQESLRNQMAGEWVKNFDRWRDGSPNCTPPMSADFLYFFH